jgi:hypothetical protein
VKTMLKNWFLYILKCLHIVAKGSLVHDRFDLCYDSIGQMWLLLDNLVQDYQRAWNAFLFLCVNECMVNYNGSTIGSNNTCP